MKIIDSFRLNDNSNDYYIISIDGSEKDFLEMKDKFPKCFSLTDYNKYSKPQKLVIAEDSSGDYVFYDIYTPDKLMEEFNEYLEDILRVMQILMKGIIKD